MQIDTCPTCKHYRALRSCDAFPAIDSIPDEIWDGKNDHREPVEGDHGIQYEPIIGTK